MYEEFYGLRELPFELTPNPRFLFLTPEHREALSNLQHGVQARKSLTLLIGEPGTGKTTLIRALISGLENARAYFAYINNPRLKREEFFELLAMGFGLSPGATSSKATLLKEMEQALETHTASGRVTALIVDEAQSLSEDLLEEVRLLANIETDAVRLLPVVLAGHRALADRLNRSSWWQLKQRVSLRCDLHPLDVQGTAAYIQARIRTAGGLGQRLFTREAVTLIHERSGGVPRVINTLCDNALIGGFAAQTRPVRRAIVQEVCRDFELGQSEQADSADEQPPKAALVRTAPRSDPVQPQEKFELPGSFEMPDWVGKRGTDGHFDWGQADETRSRLRGGSAAVMERDTPEDTTVRPRRFLFF